MTNRLHEVSAVQESNVHDVAARYGLGTVISWAFCGQGVVNTNIRVDASRGSYLLRVYAPDRAAEEVSFELSILTHLHRSGFPAPQPVSDVNGNQVGRLDTRSFSVLTFLPGSTVEQSDLSETLAHQVGARYAAFREAVTDFVPDGARENGDHPTVAPLVDALLCELTVSHPMEAEVIGQAWRAAEPTFRHRPDDELAVVHGDLFYENILVREGELAAFIDFDDAYLGLPLLDLAFTVMEFATPPDETLDVVLAEAVLSGYLDAGGKVTVEAEAFYDALLFLCCKFLCYTLPLSKQNNEPLTSNTYYRRLLDLSDPTRRGALEAAFRSLLPS